LDSTSRLLVFEAIKQWRRNRTTIVITHDLSQISPDDFIYLLKDGHLAEQGFRADLEADPHGEFTKISESQNLTGGFVPQQPAYLVDDEERDEWVEEVERDREEMNAVERKHFSAFAGNPTLPAPSGHMWLDSAEPASRGPSRLEHSRGPSRLGHVGSEHGHSQQEHVIRPRRRSLVLQIPDAETIAQRREQAWRRSSLQHTPTTATGSFASREEDEAVIEDDDEFEEEKDTMQRTAINAQRRRVKSDRRRWDTTPVAEDMSSPKGQHRRLKRSKSALRASGGPKPAVPRPYLPDLAAPAPKDKIEIASPTAENKPHLPFFKLLRLYWPTVPNKFVFVLGLFFAVLAGICTPIFGFFLSQLVLAITTTQDAGAHDESRVNEYGVLVLCLAIGSGLTFGIKYFLIEYVGHKWMMTVREKGFEKIVMQDKKWFDLPNNAPSQLLHLLIRDPDDAKSFLTSVLPQLIVVLSMLGTGIIWALIRGWQLTLVAFGLIPVFLGLSTIQNRLSGQYESRNKQRREAVNRKYYDAIANVRAIRAMSFERVFKEQFERALESAMKSGVDGGFVDGMAFGIANSIIYLAQGALPVSFADKMELISFFFLFFFFFPTGLIYFVGAVFIVQGIYTFLQMLEVLNLIAFSLVIAVQGLYFSEL